MSTCPECGNFTVMGSLGGRASWECKVCSASGTSSEYIMHSLYIRPGANIGSMELTPDEERTAIRMSYDKNLMILEGTTCKTCKGSLSVYIDSSNLYIYVCTKCHTASKKAD